MLKEGWVRVDVPAGLMVRAARIDNRPIPIVQAPSPHVLLSKPGRVVITLEVVAPLAIRGGVESVTIPASRGAVSRVALVVPRQGIAVTAAGGVLSERAQQPEGRWVAFGRAGQPLVLSWQRRADDRASAPLKWRGDVTTLVGLGEDASSMSSSIDVEVTQGAAPFVDVEIPDGVTVNQVAGPLVADWDVAPSRLRVNFLEPVTARATFTLAGELRAPREGTVTLPLVRLRAAEREGGGVAVEVLGAGEIAGRDPRGLEPADPSDLGAPVRGRESPSMLAFTYRAQPGTTARALSLQVARYTPQAVLIASIEEARYDVLLDEEGKALVRARYAVRNNQRAFLAVRLPEGATLWSAAVAGRAAAPGPRSERRRAGDAREGTLRPGSPGVRRGADLRPAQRRLDRQGPGAGDAADGRPARGPIRCRAAAFPALRDHAGGRRHVPRRDRQRPIHGHAAQRRRAAGGSPSRRTGRGRQGARRRHRCLRRAAAACSAGRFPSPSRCPSSDARYSSLPN